MVERNVQQARQAREDLKARGWVSASEKKLKSSIG
jgi:hypothetical protein